MTSAAAPSSAIDRDFYLQSQVADRLEPYRALLADHEPWLAADYPNQLTNRQLASLALDLVVAQDELLGRAVSERHLDRSAHTTLHNSSWLPKVPFACFVEPLVASQPTTPSRSAPFYLIAARALQFLRGRQVAELFAVKRTELGDEVVAQLFAEIEQALRDAHVLRYPAVAFAAGVDDPTRANMTRAVEALRGSVVEQSAGPSHVVYPSQTEALRSPSSGSPTHFRPVARLAGRVLVHWVSYPDSYDSWQPESSAYAVNLDTLGVSPSSCNVSAKWVEDSLLYNEWMNAEDYEVDLSAAESTQAPPTVSAKRKFPVPHEGDPESSDKRHKTDTDATAPEDFVKFDQPPTHDKLTHVNLDDPEARAAAPGRRSEFEPVVAGDISNISHTESSMQAEPTAEFEAKLDQQSESLAVAAENPDTMQSEGPAEALAANDAAAAHQPLKDEAPLPVALAPEEVQDRAREYLAQQTYEVVIPSYSAWFAMDKIHQNEVRTLPEFFNGRNRSKTPAIYKDYRDFMINTYRLNPTEYLTFTACRRNLTGDVCAIMRVHAFLEQWGLINYQVDPDTRPSIVGPPFTGHFKITADTPRGLQPFLPNVSVTSAANQRASTTPAPKGALNMALRKHMYEDATANGIKPSPSQATSTPASAPTARYYCFTCGVECTKQRYHCAKVKRMDLCPPCYLEGRFPSTLFSGDFVKLESSSLKQTQGDPWTDEETLLLLEGIEMYDNDWFRIADHVGTRTREQCIAQFLQLPIEDPYLESSMAQLGPLQYQQNIPFSQANNPVMSVVAFLAANVNPGVAAAAAQSALKELAASAGKAKTKAKASDSASTKADGASATSSEPKADKPTTINGSTEMKVDTTNTEAPQTVPEADTKDGDEPTSADDQASLDHSSVTRAAMAALGAAAAKAHTLATYEERQIQSLVQQAVETQLKKLELKMREFEELEAYVQSQQQELERERLKLVQERLQLRKAASAALVSSAPTPTVASTTEATLAPAGAPAIPVGAAAAVAVTPVAPSQSNPPPAAEQRLPDVSIVQAPAMTLTPNPATDPASLPSELAAAEPGLDAASPSEPGDTLESATATTPDASTMFSDTPMTE
ncbi:SWI/SNF and RSC complex subunit Ssr2 [Dimargaris xerosporica]|nr:SWI/SNF and RSC complex subunit Ssr2 [Dimargaris xerosporica]